MDTVLVVDDNELVLETIGLILGQVGIDVAKASTPAEALRFLELSNFKLAICDMQMPMDETDATMTGGHYTITQILNKNPGCKVFAISGDCSSEARELSQNLGASKLIQKPFKIEELVRLVEETLKSV